jgi:hypothetical protein
MSDKGVLRKRCDPSISGLHLNIFDFTPLLDHELLLHPFTATEWNFVCRKNCKSLNGTGRMPRLSGNIDVRGRPVQQKSGSTRSIRGGIHQRCRPRWSGHLDHSFQEDSTKSRLVTTAGVACCQGRRRLLCGSIR